MKWVIDNKMKEYKTRKLNRLKEYDYSLNGYYYVTIYSKNRKNIFGEIINNEKSVGASGYWPDNNAVQIKLNKFGLIVDEELKNTENIRHEIKLDKYVMMPNHLHCIIIINRAASQPPLLCVDGAWVNSGNSGEHGILGKFGKFGGHIT